MINVKLSKTISYILRHHPEKYHLTLDSEGWIDIDELLKALENDYGEVSIKDIHYINDHSDKKRFEIKNHRIRAYYGHSFHNKIKRKEVIPPTVLYHGTSPKNIPSIMKKGLLPMNRQYVHLSSDKQTAINVGKRYATNPVILEVKALEAFHAGIHFYKGNEDVWLSDEISPLYIVYPD